MLYRVCKSFEIESGHMLSKHPGRCRFPHGHSRRVELVLACETLDDRDMVCDFKAVKLAVADFLDTFDHAMAVNSADPNLPALRAADQRVVVFEGVDPTTEVMARRIYEHLEAELARGGTYADESGATFSLRPEVSLERVRVSETSSSWAEYAKT
ncbi:MAG: 6-carboxytetrahydropterin synthase [Phycisphaerales bacterium]